MPLCLADRKHLCNFGRGHHDEHFYEFILNFDQCFRRRCRLKIFHIRVLEALLFSGAQQFVQSWNHEEHSGIMGIIRVKLF